MLIFWIQKLPHRSQKLSPKVSKKSCFVFLPSHLSLAGVKTESTEKPWQSPRRSRGFRGKVPGVALVSSQTSQDLRMLSRSLSDCQSLTLNGVRSNEKNTKKSWPFPKLIISDYYWTGLGWLKPFFAFRGPIRAVGGRKIDFSAVLRLCVGPLRLKRLQKDHASHGIALDTPHANMKKKNWPKMGPQILDLGSGMAKNGRKWSKCPKFAFAIMINFSLILRCQG